MKYHDRDDQPRAVNDNRDDTTPPSGNGPLTPGMDKWEHFPLNVSLEMPPPRAAHPEFVRAADVQQAIDAWRACDAERLDAVMWGLANMLAPQNGNSGPAAPIQGQG